MKTGNQKPTFSVIGKYSYSLGDEVVEMFEEEGGATFYPSQKNELRLFLARNADDSPAALTIGLSKPRQNGKSYAARYYAVYMGDFEHRQVLYSAHHSTTTNKMFKALCNLFESPERYPDFANDVKSISHVRGYEGIYFKDWKDEDGQIHDGGCIEFATRTNSGSRGGTYSVIIIDEAQEFTTDQQEAVLPVISAAADVTDLSQMPQQILIGTPPGPSCHGTVFPKMHQEAHTNSDCGFWWLEWSEEVNNIEGFNLTEDKALKLAYKTNPAMGYRISEKTVLNEYETMSLDGFLRERVGWWAPSVEKISNYAIPADVWDACVSDEQKPEGKTAYGVKFSTDGSKVALCGAVIPEDGPARISLIELKSTSHGTQWLADWLNARYEKAACVVIDGRNGVDVLIDKIKDTWKAKNSIIRPSVKEVIAATSTLMNDLAEKNVTWYRGQEVLRDSAINSTKRPISGGYGFGGENNISIPIEACSLALWGAKTTKRVPGRRMLIG